MSSHFFDAFVFSSQAYYFAKREDLKSLLKKTFLFPIWLQSFPLPRARNSMKNTSEFESLIDRLWNKAIGTKKNEML